MPSKPTTDVDNEDSQRLMDCLDLFVAAGYFRARIKGLATFDKIVGGMVWCLSHCNRTIDADLLFAENLDIGQKIALTEKIVKVLTALKCPHIIEPHQIQGLDLENIYPVIQWLVRMAMDSKASRAQYLNSYIDYQYQRSCKKPTSPTPTIWMTYRDLHASVIPKRKFKRGKDVKVATLLEDAYCTLAEYSRRPDTVRGGVAEGASTTAFQSDQLEELGEKQRFKVSMKTAKRIFEAIDENVEAAAKVATNPEEAALDAQLERAKRYLNELDKEVEAKKNELAEVNEEYETLVERKRQEDEVFKRFTPEEIEQARTLLENYNSARKAEREFKEAARAELARLEEQIEQCKATPQEISEQELKEVEEQLAAEQLRLAEITQIDAALSYKLDSIPSQTEMAQYQQRFIELSNQMGSKQRQTRQSMNLYNTLIDVRDYIKKDIELLSKIEEVLPLATKESYRDSFIDNLNTILRSVENSQKKVNDRTVNLTEEKNRLTAKYNRLKDNRRQFNQMVEQLKVVSCECVLVSAISGNG